MKSLIVKRSIILRGHKTSVSLEEPFWKALKDIAINRRVTTSQLVSSIDVERNAGNLSSAVRLFVLNHYRQKPGDQSITRQAARPADTKTITQGPRH